MTNAATILQTSLTWGPLALLLVSVLVGAYLHLSLRVDFRLLARRGATRAEIDSRVSELVAELETMRARLAVVESRPAQGEWSTPAVNLNRRGQILRLHGKGRNTEEIASDLQISQGEVELLLKVYDWPAASAL